MIEKIQNENDKFFYVTATTSNHTPYNSPYGMNDMKNAFKFTDEAIDMFVKKLTEINYFDNQRAKSTGNIGEGEYISRNIDIESTAEIIFYETTTTEVVPSGDNELNAILNSPFIS